MPETYGLPPVSHHEGNPPPDLEGVARVLGDRLRVEREQRGWSGSELARRTGIDQSSISKYERGERFPTSLARERIEDAFGWPRGRIVRLAGIAEEPATLDDFLAGRPLLTDADRALVMRVVEHLERSKRPSL